MILFFMEVKNIKEKLKSLLIKPNELPEIVEIDNTLEAKQELVGGYIECTYLPNDDNVVLICNEEGKINGMKLNRDIGHDIIAGPFLIVGDDYENGDFKSLTEEQIIKYKELFNEKSIKLTNKKIEDILIKKMKDRIDKEER